MLFPLDGCSPLEERFKLKVCWQYCTAIEEMSLREAGVGMEFHKYFGKKEAVDRNASPGGICQIACIKTEK